MMMDDAESNKHSKLLNENSEISVKAKAFVNFFKIYSNLNKSLNILFAGLINELFLSSANHQDNIDKFLDDNKFVRN
jgi:hypothetical protein